MRPVLNWLAAAASLIGLFFTLRPVAGTLSSTQIEFIVIIVVVFGAAAFVDIREERRRAAKRYKDSTAINGYMYRMLRDSGNCEICSRDASWVSEEKVYSVLKDKACRGELTFLVHYSTEKLNALATLGAEIIEYGPLGLDPVTRFTIVNAGNIASSYVAVGRQKPNESHIIEEFDSSDPTYSMAQDLVRSIRVANDQYKKSKSLAKITCEWDAIAALREQQVASGKDHSANFVLAPAILAELPKVHYLVDIGCGTGWLASRAAPNAKVTVGLDPSRESIAIAQAQHAGDSITYFTESVEQYAQRRARPKFDAAISNMAASSTPSLEKFFAASRRILKKEGLLIATIPHPCFWPLYWGYASHPKFHYKKSFAVEGEFKIQEQSTQILTTHFHHPLEQYVSVLANVGLAVEAVQELAGRGFPFPRFMLFVSRAV